MFRWNKGAYSISKFGLPVLFLYRYYVKIPDELFVLPYLVEIRYVCIITIHDGLFVHSDLVETGYVCNISIT